MRTIQTLILRLLVDTDAPPTLRGAVQGVADSETHPFADEQALLGLLRGWVCRPSNTAASAGTWEAATLTLDEHEEESLW